MTARLALLRPLTTHAGKALPVLALAGCGYLLGDRLAGFQVADIGVALAQVSVWQWLGAVAATCASFAAIGQYDAVIHRVMGTGVRPGRARWAGMRAIALSQTVGFSSLSGGLVRLRCLPELDLWTVSRLSVLVSLSFLGAWVVLAGGAVLWQRGGPTGVIVLIVLLLGLIVVCVARFRPAPNLPGLSPQVGVALLVWTALDTSFAALVLGLLMPAGLMPDLGLLLTAYLLALGAGLLSQSPAGLGAFELTLLLLLPQVPDAPLLAAVLAYRVIYFLVPAVLALIFLIRPAMRPAPCPLHPAQGAARTRALSRAPRADWGLAHQGAEVVLSRDQATGWLLRPAAGCLVALGQPLGRPDLAGLADLARTRGRTPVIYKCDGRTAAQARAAGWSVLRLSQEAVLRADLWSPALPACRQLRRKLRSVQDHDLRIEDHPPVLPLARMALLAHRWSLRNGGEKGFSMGRFDAGLLGRQRVLLGHVGDRLVGFASFHIGREEWSLDLMRQDDTAPDGTMHALIEAGVRAAFATGCTRVSLAAVPLLPGRWEPWSDRLPGVAGLRQFKRSFGAVWRPLYLCAPGPVALLKAAAAITHAVHRPPALPDGTGQRSGPGIAAGGAAQALPGDLADFEIELPDQACERPGACSVRASAANPADLRPSTGPLHYVRSRLAKRSVPPA